MPALRQHEVHLARTAAGELPELATLAAAWLPELRPADTWPQVWHPRSRAEVCTLCRGGEVLAMAAARRVRLVVGDTTCPVTLLGSVVTAPHRRAQGHARELLQRIAEAEVAADQHALLLWSDQRELWRRLGFAPAGEQHEVQLTFTSCDGAPAPVSGGRVRPALAGDLPALLALHEAKPARVRRDLHELALQLSARPSAAFVLERNGHLAAYACHGKGADFAGWWHEVGGSDADVAELLLALAARMEQPRTMVLVPPYRGALLEHLAPWTLARRTGAGALARPLLVPLPAGFFVDGLDAI